MRNLMTIILILNGMLVQGQISLESTFQAFHPLKEFGINTNSIIFGGVGLDFLYTPQNSANVRFGTEYSYARHDVGFHTNTLIITPLNLAFIEEAKTNVSMQGASLYIQYRINKEDKKINIYGEVGAGINGFISRKKSIETYFKTDSNGDGIFNSNDDNATSSEIESVESENLRASKPIVQHKDFSPLLRVGFSCKYNLNSACYLILKSNFIHGFKASYFDNGSNLTDEISIDNWNIVSSNTSTIRLSMGLGLNF